MIVEVSGSVEKPGVYNLKDDSRIKDALIAAGGLSSDADRDWVERALNRASKVFDGQKIYIPSVNEHSDVLSADKSGGGSGSYSGQSSDGEKLININSASQKDLENLWGIGPVYAQNIIEHRPYSSVEELLTKGVIRKDIYERNKDLLTVY